MARKCPDCGHMNDDDLIFCEECGEPVDPKTRLMMELEGKTSSSTRSGVGRVASASNEGAARGSKRRDNDDDDDYIPSYHVEEEKKSPLGLILGLAVVAAVVWFLFFR